MIDMPTSNRNVSEFPSAEPLPPPVQEILQHRERIRQRYPLFQTKQYRVSRAQQQDAHPSSAHSSITRWLARLNPFSPRVLVPPALPDTPSAALYRMYEFLIADWTTQLRNELEYFCCERPSWAVFDIPDPDPMDRADSDPLRYAVLAVLTKLMCVAFNRRVDYGLPRDAPAIIEDFEEIAARTKVYERPPEWAMRVPPLAEMVFVPDETGRTLGVDDEDVSVEFRKMNIIMREPHIHFV